MKTLLKPLTDVETVMQFSIFLHHLRMWQVMLVEKKHTRVRWALRLQGLSDPCCPEYQSKFF